MVSRQQVRPEWLRWNEHPAVEGQRIGEARSGELHLFSATHFLFLWFYSKCCFLAAVWVISDCDVYMLINSCIFLTCQMLDLFMSWLHSSAQPRLLAHLSTVTVGDTARSYSSTVAKCPDGCWLRLQSLSISTLDNQLALWLLLEGKS